MTLVCKAFGGPDEGPSADALAVPLTTGFLQALRARQRLVQRLLGTAGAASLDSVLFREPAPVWFSWAEDLEDVILAAEALGWTLTEQDLSAPPAVRTGDEVMQVWPGRLQFRCRLRHTAFAIESSTLHFQDLFAAAAQRLPAAERRNAV